MKKFIITTFLTLAVGLLYCNAQSHQHDPSTPPPKEQDEANEGVRIPDPTQPDTSLIDGGPGAIVDTLNTDTTNLIKPSNNEDKIIEDKTKIKKEVKKTESKSKSKNK